MATKWKSKALLVAGALSLAIGWSLLLSSIRPAFMNTNELLEPENFGERLSSLYLVDYLANANSQKLTSDSVNYDQINDYRYRYGDLDVQIQDISDQYSDGLSQAKKNGRQTEYDDLIKERDEKILAIVANFTDDEVVKEKIIEKEQAVLKEQGSALLKTFKESNQAFAKEYWYYLQDGSGKVYKNVPGITSDLSNNQVATIIKEKGIGQVLEISMPIMLPEQLNNLWSQNDENRFFTGYLSLVPKSEASHLYQKIEKERLASRLIFASAIFLLISGIVLGIFFIRQPVSEERVATILQKIPLDIRVGITVLLGILLLMTSFEMSWSSMGLSRLAILSGYHFIVMILGLVICKNLWVGLVGREGYPLWQEQKNRSVIAIVGQWLAKLPKELMITGCLLACLGLLIKSWQFGYQRRILAFGALFVSSSLFSLGIGFFFIKSYRRLLKMLQRPANILADGDESYEKGLELAQVNQNLTKIEEIVKTTKAHKLRNEELKTELLTNVSHDLRTPLTSIISYGDLLRKQDLKGADREAYTEIINRKALRMKDLIDDLFEVTKMNNGEIILDKKIINLGQLVQQSIAEYGDEFAEKELKMLYKKPKEPLLINIDGERMWRVFDNLIGNVIKYSMPGTRVYLKVYQEENEASIQLKNISQYELNEEASSLVERFTRGDEARNTEGSGLGLAIANSIVDLHEGRLDIQVDGDMFKICIKLPIEKIKDSQISES